MAPADAWGTLEELLLAFAVNRHGADRWSFVAMEIQKRIRRGINKNTSPNASFTPRDCEHRYDALKRQFDVTDDVGERDLREVLRRRRVEELRCELERRDSSIASLELEEGRQKAIRPDPVQAEPVKVVRLGSTAESKQPSIGGGDSGELSSKIENKSEPLIQFLKIVQSHSHSSVFVRRLPTRETHKYKKLIRQHMDLETIETKLYKGVYSDSHSSFFRDLLLLFTNAILFFHITSIEHIAARRLRSLVTNEIAAQKGAPKPKPGLAIKPDLEPKKHSTSPDIIVCRRRRNLGVVRPRNTTPHSKTESKDKEKISYKNQRDEMAEEDDDEEDVPISKRKKNMRKEEVVNFLKRIKGNSPSMEAVKVKPWANNEGKHEERAKIRDLSKKKVVIRNVGGDGTSDLERRSDSGRVKRSRCTEGVVGVAAHKKKPRR